MKIITMKMCIYRDFWSVFRNLDMSVTTWPKFWNLEQKYFYSIVSDN